MTNIKCKMCSKVITKTNNRKQYCKDCAKEKHRQRCSDRYYNYKKDAKYVKTCKQIADRCGC